MTSSSSLTNISNSSQYVDSHPDVYYPSNNNYSNISNNNYTNIKPVNIPPPGYTTLNDGFAKVASHVSPSANLPESQKPNYNEQTYFRWESPLNETRQSAFQQNTSAELAIINQTFSDNDPTSSSNMMRDYQGNTCINSTPEKVWYAKNVALIFGTGAIYDSEDDKIMNAIMAYFVNNQESGFLMNHHRVESYINSKLIQDIESKLHIDNGNYHVFMVPIVYATDENVLLAAPEPKYRVSGIIDKYMKWQSITDYMREAIAKYGFITTIERPHDPLSWEIGQDGLATKRGIHNDVECKFDIEVDPDLHDTPIQKDLEFKRDLEQDYNVRQHQTKMNRLGDYNQEQSAKRMKLYEQMNGGIVDSELTNATVFDANLGVQLRLNEKYYPENKKYVEYQLHSDDSYENGQNIISQMAVSPKLEMPQFQLTNTRGAKSREASLGGSINQYNNPKLPTKSNLGYMNVGHMAPHAVRSANRARNQGALGGYVSDGKNKY